MRIYKIFSILALFAFAPFAHAQSDGHTYLQFGCDQCHGRVGQGSGAGLRLAPAPLEFEDFADIVRRPYGVMPAYSPKVLSDEQLGRIHAYLSGIPEPPALDAIPLLQLD